MNQNIKNLIMMSFIFTGCYYTEPVPLSDSEDTSVSNNSTSSSRSSSSGGSRRRRRSSGGGSGSPSSYFVSLCDRDSTSFQQAVINAIPDKSECSAITESDINSVIELRVNQSLSSFTLADLTDFNSLQSLHLNNTGLTSLDENLFSLISETLQLLNLSGNSLDNDLASGLFAGLSKLLDLDLSDNDFTTLPANLFSGLSSLEVLYLNDNSLEALPDGLFQDLSNLEELDLSGNSLALSDLTVNVLRGLSSHLVELDLSDNNFASSDGDSICDRLKSLITSDLDVEILNGGGADDVTCSN